MKIKALADIHFPKFDLGFAKDEVKEIDDEIAEELTAANNLIVKVEDKVLRKPAPASDDKE